MQLSYFNKPISMSTTLSESEFLRSYDPKVFDAPLTTVDTVIFTVKDTQLQVLLVKRNDHPALGKWALPGGFIRLQEDADLDAAALRILKTKTGVASPYVEQLMTVGNKQRDPRGWSVTVVYFALINSDAIDLSVGGNSDAVAWFPITDNAVSATLAFDHDLLLENALQRLRAKTEYSALPVHLLPEQFTLGDLQKTFEIILGRPIDKSAFRRRINDAAILEEIVGAVRGGANRPAQLFRLKDGTRQHFFPRTITSGA